MFFFLVYFWQTFRNILKSYILSRAASESLTFRYREHHLFYRWKYRASGIDLRLDI